MILQIPGDANDGGEAILADGLTWVDWAAAAGIVAAGVVLAVIVRRTIQRALGATEMPVSVRRILGRLAAGAVFAVAAIYALGRLGVRIGPLLGAAGIIGIALAFALQDILENLVAGVMLQARRPFSIGDQVMTNDYEGTVEDVNTRATVIRTFDGRRVFMPNAVVLKNALENRTAYALRRTTVQVGIAYGSDLASARDVLNRAVDSVAGVADAPPPEVYVEALGASSIDFTLLFWHEPEIAAEWRTRHEVVLAVYGALDEAEITIPFPQRTLHLAAPEELRAAAPGSGAGDSETGSETVAH